MIKVASKSKQIRDYAAANPKATQHDIADAIGVKVSYVYTVLWNAKKKAVKVKAAKAQWKNITMSTSNVSIKDRLAKLMGATMTTDDISKITPERMSELAYQAGKGKSRMLGNRVLAVEMLEPESDTVR